MLRNKVDLLFIGGHHSSALPLALLFKNKGYSLVFVGHKYNSLTNKFVSSEYKEVTSYGIPYIHLSSPKFYNVKGISKYIKLLVSIFKSFIILLKYRPKVIVSYGGYLAVPLAFSGRLLGLTVVTHEQTAVSGLANKVVTKFSNLVFLTWKSSLSHYPNKKTLLVGLPLREEILSIKPRTINKKYNLKALFVQGGKQGSHILNDFIFNNLKVLTKDFIIYHSTGRHSLFNDYTRAKKYKKLYKNYFPFDYVFGNDYMNLLKKVDFLITRSGAHMVYELCYLKIPAIFVPIPWSSNQEQKHNALAAGDYIPRVILEQKNLNLSNFKKSVLKLNSLLKTSSNFKTVKTDATKRMFKVIKDNFL